VPTAAPEVTVDLPETNDSAGDPTDPADRPKRRRGTRGGRNRRKPGEAASTAAAAGGEKAVAAAPEKKPARSPRAPTTEKADKTEKPERERGRRERAPSSRRRQPPKRAPLPKAKRELLVSVDIGEQRVAVLEDGRVAEVYLERPERRSIAGNIYLGSVDNVLPGMEAAFIEIGLEKNGFLYVDEIVSPELEKGHGRKIQDLISRG